MNTENNIVYLYAELMGYQIPVFNELVEKYGYKLHVFHDTKGKMAKFTIPKLNGVQFFRKEDFSEKQLYSYVYNLKPSLVYVSGWMYKDYVKVIFKLRKKRIYVVCGFDDIWHSTFKQRIARFIFPFIKKYFFSHAWVAGPYQFEYATQLGFKKNEIIFNCLTADVEKFNKSYFSRRDKIVRDIPKRFLYVGRLSHVKGVDILVEAWGKLGEFNHEWTLTIVGNGPLLNSIACNSSNIELIDFKQTEDLVKMLDDFSCIIIPSRKEQWSVAMHEFSAAGFPIICSSVCGAIPLFMVHNFNGYIYSNNSVSELVVQMLKIINAKPEELIEMSNNSHLLGQRITPEIVAASLLSIL